MVVDFSKIDYKKIPTLVLRNLSMEPIGIIRNAIDLSADLHYNETSSLSFTVPSVIDGERSETYDKIKGMQIVDWVDVGQFLLVNPTVTNDGVREVKEVNLYSLEYEFTFKLVNLAGGTYKFYDAIEPENTIIGIIMEKMPSWSLGEIDSALWNKYRTFDDITNTNVYNFIKSNVQQSYQCIFDFDTYERKVNVRSVSAVLTPKPVYLSLRNLMKNVEVSEDTESIVTCSTVDGADGVDIMSVNPLGTNKIYNLDYFMTEDNFSDEMIAKWDAWKAKYDSYLTAYYNLTVAQSLKTQEYASIGLDIGTLEGELTKLENEQVVVIQGVSDGGFEQSRLTEINAAIAAKKSEIETAKAKQQSVYDEIYGDGGILAQQAAINKDCAFANNFTSDELLVLDRYFIEQPISEASFVMSDIGTYDAVSAGGALAPLIYFSGANISITKYSSYNRYTFTVKDYSYFEIQDSSFPVTGVLKSATVDYYPSSRTASVSATLGSGYYGAGDNKTEFTSATVSFSGGMKCSLFDTDATAAGVGGTYIKLYIASGSLSLTAGGTTKAATYSTYGSMSVSDSTVIQTKSGDTIYIGMAGGSFELTLNSTTMTGEIVNGTVSYDDPADGLMFTAYLANGFVGGAAFANATLTVVGAASSVVTNADSSSMTDGSSVSFGDLCGTYFFTQSVSEYAKRSTERELYDYGVTALNKLAYPSYSFDVDSANFLASEDFDLFKQELELGEKVYVEFSDGRVMTPIAIGASLNMDDATSLTIEFGDKYSSSAGEFLYEDLLEQSVNTSRDVSLKNWTYSAFIDSGAKNSVQEYMTAAQDYAKQSIMSSGDQAITIDDAGIRLRKYSDDTHTSFDDCQIWMNNNTILFTDDNWASAKIAIGQFKDDNTGMTMGIVAPSIAGTLLAGEELVIESSKREGGVAVFKMDADGASLHNANFNLYNSTGARIELNPDMGILAGDLNNAFSYDDTTGAVVGVKTKSTSSSSYGSTITKLSQLSSGYAPVTNFWMDMDGSVYLKGTVYASDGEFSGKISATMGSIGGWNIGSDKLYSGSGSTYVGLSSYSGDTYAIWAGASTASGAPFSVSRGGYVTATNGSFSGTLNAEGLYLDGRNVNLIANSGTSYAYINAGGSSGYVRNIDADYITTGTLSADYIKLGGDMTLYQGVNSSYVGGTWGFGSSITTGTNVVYLRSYSSGSYTSELALQPYGARLTVSSGGSALAQIGVSSNNAFADGSEFIPNSDGDMLLGDSSNRWSVVYATTSTINTSDKTEKNSIDYDVSKYEALFNILQPCSYKFNSGTSGRTHTGFIAQDIEEELERAGLTSLDFAAFIKSPIYDDDDETILRYAYGLRYEEFIALNTHMIKKLQGRISELEAKISDLERT